jgi:hypothetical protein
MKTAFGAITVNVIEQVQLGPVAVTVTEPALRPARKVTLAPLVPLRTPSPATVQVTPASEQVR